MIRNPNIDRGLAIMELILQPGERANVNAMAAACCCHKSRIQQIEKQALNKIRGQIMRDPLLRDLFLELEAR